MVGSTKHSRLKTNSGTSSKTLVTRRRVLQGAAATGAAITTFNILRPLAAQAAQSDQLIIAIPNTPPRADPHFIDQFIEHELLDNIGSRLVEWTSTVRPNGFRVQVLEGIAPIEPLLAESWEQSEDKLTYTMRLRRGVKSFVGNELTSEDVRYTYDRWVNVGGHGSFFLGAMTFPGMENFKVIDRYTFSITTSRPNTMFFKMLGLPHFSILDSTEIKKHATSDDPWAAKWLKTHSASFGPYHITEWTPGQQIILTANPNYFQGPPPIGKVVMKEVPDSANRLALLVNGDIDIAHELLARERLAMKGVKEITIYSVEPGHKFSQMGMTNTVEPYNNKKVRQAVCYAIPYDELVSTVTSGTGRRQMSPLPAPYEFYDPTLNPYSTDLDKAKQLLAEAGYADGFETSLGFSTAAPEDEESAKIIQAGLAKVGIKVKLNKQPFAAYVERWLGLGVEQFPMSTMQLGAAVADSGYALSLWWFSQNNILDFVKYENREVDRLIDELKAEFNLGRREELTKKIQSLILDDAPNCYLIEPGIHFPVRSNVKGLGYYTDSGLRYYTITK